MIDTILLVIIAVGMLGLNVLLILHMIHMKTAFDKVENTVQRILGQRKSQ